MPAVDDAGVRGTSPTARLVLATLRERGPSSQGDLVEATGRSRRAIRSAVQELEACDAISVSVDLRDARRRRYEATG